MENEIAAIVEDHGAKLYGTETAKEGENLIYRVLIVRDGGVDVEVCADISAELSPFLDVNPPVSGNYFLEVSSPGIERKLKTMRQFELSIGEKVQLKLQGNEKLKGVLVGAKDNTVAVETEFGIEEYALDAIKSARTYFEW